MKNGIDKALLDQKMVWMGFREITSGTSMLRYAVGYWEPGMSMTNELYPRVAKEFGSTPGRVERAMRHAIETAWDRGDPGTINACFGYSTSPEKGKPTVGEFVSRMARVCSNED